MEQVRVPVVNKYEIIYVDCPWDYKRKGGPKCAGTAAQSYPTLSDEQIYNLNISELAAKNCIVFSWSTWPKLREGITAIERWGFRYVTVGFVWVKVNRKNKESLFWGTGHYTRANTEICLLGVKGKPEIANHGVHSVIIDESFPRLVVAPHIRHSQKPDIVRDKILLLCGDKKRIELFARQLHCGWDAWGKEL